jgi:hypothetical protein
LVVTFSGTIVSFNGHTVKGRPRKGPNGIGGVEEYGTIVVVHEDRQVTNAGEIRIVSDKDVVSITRDIRRTLASARERSRSPQEVTGRRERHHLTVENIRGREAQL